MTKEKKIHEQIKDALDGRTNRWLSKKTGINEADLSRAISGKLILTQKRYDKINAVLGTNITIKEETH